jgi:hypothetical protein
VDNRYELKVLRHIAKLLSNESRQLRMLGAIRNGCYVVSWVSIAILVASLAGNGIAGVLVVVGAAVAGALAGIAAYASVSLKQWPIMKQHISQESIVKRLKELET